MNGRRLPYPGRYEHVNGLLAGMDSCDYLAVMLGSNDILMSEDSDAALPVRHMEDFLNWLSGKIDMRHVILIAPYPAGSADAFDPVYRHFYSQSLKMNEGFRSLSKAYGCLFADTSSWGIETAYDMIHFSQAGHRTFAEHMLLWIKTSLCT